jgi:hypothetical protein
VTARVIASRLRDAITRHLESCAPLGGCFWHEPRTPLADLENVVVAPLRIARVDDLVVRRLWIDFDRQPVAFAADTFDLNHEHTLLGESQLAC